MKGLGAEMAFTAELSPPTADCWGVSPPVGFFFFRGDAGKLIGIVLISSK